MMMHQGNTMNEFTMKLQNTEGGDMEVLLTNTATGKPTTFKDLKTSHTKKLHIFAISKDLESYVHATRKQQVQVFILLTYQTLI